MGYAQQLWMQHSMTLQSRARRWQSVSVQTAGCVLCSAAQLRVRKQLLEGVTAGAACGRVAH